MTELPLDRPNTLAERVAQLIFVRIGSNLPPIKRASQDKERISKLLEKHPLGGLVLFNAKWPDLQETLRDLQSISRYPLLVAADLERGAGQQIHGLGVFPHARAFSELAGDQLDAVQEAAYLTARQALAVGVQVILGPVADVNSNPHNPIIATRAFANTPEGAAKLVTAYIEGAKKGGAICVPKHFPGHGDTQQDSHATLPVVRKTYDELQQCELPPFEAAITAGVPMIMTAHVAYPMLDPSGEPATVSTKILNHLLRKDLKFDGAICSDSLLMAGVRDRYTTEGDCAIAALSAGVDLLLDLVEPDLAIKSITRAVESGELAEERVNDAFDRVWKLKSGYFRSSISSEDPLSFQHEVDQLSQLVAEKAIRMHPATASWPEAGSIKGPLCLVRVHTQTTSYGSQQTVLADELRVSFPNLDFCELGSDQSESVIQQFIEATNNAATLVIGLVVKPSAWNRFGLLDWQVELIRNAIKQAPNAIVISFGVPSVLDAFPEANCRLCAYSDVESSQRAVATLLKRYLLKRQA